MHEEQELRDIVITRTSRAPVEAVYEVLVDLDSHLEWSGRRNHRSFRLLTMEAPSGQAAVGTEWRSTGLDPGGRFSDRSVVTEATRPTSLEYVTESTYEWKRSRRPPMQATIVSRFDLEPWGSGSRIAWRSRTVRLEDAPRFMRGPILGRVATWIGRLYSRRAVRNLARFAEERAVAHGQGR